MGWWTQEECGLGAPMAFSEELAERIRQGLARKKGFEEKDGYTLAFAEAVDGD
jgi:hypothetical protein